MTVSTIEIEILCFFFSVLHSLIHSSFSYTDHFLSHIIMALLIQNAAERTPRFGRGIASGGERVQWWGARRRTAVYVPFSVYTMAWSGEYRAFIVEEFIRNGGSPVATQRAFRFRFALGRRETS